MCQSSSISFIDACVTSRSRSSTPGHEKQAIERTSASFGGETRYMFSVPLTRWKAVDDDLLGLEENLDNPFLPP